MKNPLPLGVCTGLENKKIVEQAGADFLEVNVQTFLVPSDPDAVFTPKWEAATRWAFPIRAANCFLPESLPCVGPLADYLALLAYADKAFSRAKLIGIQSIVFGSGKARAIPANFPPDRARSQFVDLLKKLAPLAERSSVTLVIEPLNAGECNFINTLAEGAELVAACGHPAVQLLADTFHMGFGGEGPESLRSVAHCLHHVHVADYPSRRYPGAEGASHRDYFEALRDINYQGRVSMECRWDNLAAEAAPAVANLRRDLAAAGF